MAKELAEVDLEKIETGVTQRFKELETKVLQVLGVVDPYFTRVVSGMIGEYRSYVVDIIKHNTVIDDGGGKDK